jgi:arginine decarboxylase
MKTIYNYLNEYSESDFYGMHMPGHKRNEKMMENDLPYKIDITEIDGFDDLHHADGIIREAQERAARLYGADETHFLVNGSTVGILSAIMGVTDKGDQILVARNCHKSVYHAIYLNELEPVYVYPEYDEKTGLNGEVKADEIALLLEKSKYQGSYDCITDI